MNREAVKDRVLQQSLIAIGEQARWGQSYLTFVSSTSALVNEG